MRRTAEFVPPVVSRNQRLMDWPDLFVQELQDGLTKIGAKDASYMIGARDLDHRDVRTRVTQRFDAPIEKTVVGADHDD